ncbi:unnamed protein product, partial [Didymodactylos carnosus]
GNDNDNIIQVLMKYIALQHFFFTNKPIQFDEWRYDEIGGNQDDQHSCGVHVAIAAREICTNTKYPPITKDNVKYFRQIIALDLITEAK